MGLMAVGVDRWLVAGFILHTLGEDNWYVIFTCSTTAETHDVSRYTDPERNGSFLPHLPCRHARNSIPLLIVVAQLYDLTETIA